MTMPTSQCPWRMQVHHIHQKPRTCGPFRCCATITIRTALASTLWLACVTRRKRCAPIPSPRRGVSEYITLTVRRIDEGTGSQWLTREVKRGDYLWLSDAMGEFTCDDKAEDKFLLLAAGCGVTPIMAMRRWLAKHRPQADVQVIYNVRSPEDVIFAEEWRNYPVTP